MSMELIRAMKSEEVVFGKGFVPVLTASFAGTEEEIARFINLKKSGESIHMAIDPVGKVAFEGEKGQLSIDNRSVKAMLGDAGDVCQNRKIDGITERKEEI